MEISIESIIAQLVSETVHNRTEILLLSGKIEALFSHSNLVSDDLLKLVRDEIEQQRSIVFEDQKSKMIAQLSGDSVDFQEYLKKLFS